ncbi:MAG: 6-phosphogluconolactonase [Spirochaetia bacterium]|nr:6-phosphogluconolactonase [Spirochaetia bacterium]
MHITIIKQDVQAEFPQFIKNRVRELLNKKITSNLHIGLPGGRSASGIITGIALLENSELARLQLQLIDERATGIKNYDTLMDVGLRQLIESGRFHHDQLRTLTQESEGFIQRFDILFAGVGEDGHFASLFPGSFQKSEQSKAAKTSLHKIIRITDAPKEPPERISISYAGFLELAENAEIYLLFFGEAKQDALTRLMLNEPQDALPCAFFKNNFDQVTVVTDQ